MDIELLGVGRNKPNDCLWSFCMKHSVFKSLHWKDTSEAYHHCKRTQLKALQQSWQAKVLLPLGNCCSNGSMGLRTFSSFTCCNRISRIFLISISNEETHVTVFMHHLAAIKILDAFLTCQWPVTKHPHMYVLQNCADISFMKEIITMLLEEFTAPYQFNFTNRFWSLN